MPDLLIEGLNRYDERPCLFLGENTATYKDVREATSKMVQALLEQNLGVGSRVAVLSANRPEVLYNIAAMQLSGCAGCPLHPLGSMDDHAYAMEAAEIDALVYDPTVFDDHAAALKDHIPNFGKSHFDNPEEVTQAKEIEQIIRKLVNSKLPEKCRIIFILSRIEGLSNKEISFELGLSIRTVENQIYRALKILRKHLINYL